MSLDSDDGSAALTEARPDPTGIARVDAVLAELSALPGRALAEHRAVFERAHAELRAALDEPHTDTDA